MSASFDAPVSADSFSWPPESQPDRAPYRGLRPLEAADAGIFFGRDEPLVRALETLRDLRGRDAERLFVVLGGPGIGKSSFLRAGLLPRLARNPAEFFPLPTIRPRNAAISGPDGLLASLSGAFQGVGQTVLAKELAERLGGGSGALASLLADVSRRLVDDDPRQRTSPTLVISVDQAEELFNPEGFVEGKALCEALSDALAVRSGPAAVDLLVVMALRSDRHDLLCSGAKLSRTGRRLFDLASMSPNLFAEVIEGPARRARESGLSLKIDPSLTERLVSDFAGLTDALPLLAFTLQTLYRGSDGSGDLTLTDYEERFAGAERLSILEHVVEHALRDPARPRLSPGERTSQYKILRSALIPRLAHVDPDTLAGVRRSARLIELPVDSHALLHRLIDAGLLVHDGDTIELAHDWLLTRWPMLDQWLGEEADRRRMIDRLRFSAAEWDRAQRHSDWLRHRDHRLKDAEEIAGSPGFLSDADALVRVYLEACAEAQQRREKLAALHRDERIRLAERAAEKRGELALRYRRTARAALIGLAGALAMAGWAYWQYRHVSLPSPVQSAIPATIGSVPVPAEATISADSPASELTGDSAPSGSGLVPVEPPASSMTPSLPSQSHPSDVATDMRFPPESLPEPEAETDRTPSAVSAPPLPPTDDPRAAAAPTPSRRLLPSDRHRIVPAKSESSRNSSITPRKVAPRAAAKADTVDRALPKRRGEGASKPRSDQWRIEKDDKKTIE